MDGQAHSGDLLEQMLGRITQFEIPRSQIGNLKFVLVAVHGDSFGKIISKLLDNGVFLSQIAIFHAKNMEYANILVETSHPEITMEWKGSDRTFVTQNEHQKNLGELVRTFLWDEV